MCFYSLLLIAQVLTSSEDGTVFLWDYMDNVILKVSCSEIKKCYETGSAFLNRILSILIAGKVGRTCVVHFESRTQGV